MTEQQIVGVFSELQGRLGYPPSLHELAAAAGISVGCAWKWMDLAEKLGLVRRARGHNGARPWRVRAPVREGPDGIYIMRDGVYDEGPEM